MAALASSCLVSYIELNSLLIRCSLSPMGVVESTTAADHSEHLITAASFEGWRKTGMDFNDEIGKFCGVLGAGRSALYALNNLPKMEIDSKKMLVL